MVGYFENVNEPSNYTKNGISSVTHLLVASKELRSIAFVQTSIVEI